MNSIISIKVSQLEQDEHKIVQSLTIFHPEQVESILNQLQQRTSRLMEMYEVLRVNKYARDGLTARVNNGCEKTSELVEETSKYDPTNLTGQTIEQALVSLCSKCPSFVPTPTNV